MRAWFLRFRKLHLWLLADGLLLAAYYLVRGHRAWMNAAAAHVTGPLRQAIGRVCYQVDFSVAELLCVLAAAGGLLYLLWSIAAVARRGERFTLGRWRRPVAAAVLAGTAWSLFLLAFNGWYGAPAEGRQAAAYLLLPLAAAVLPWPAAAVLADRERRRRAYSALLGAVCAGLTAWVLFCGLWGLDSYADGFQDRSGIRAQPVALSDLRSVTAYFAQQVGRTADGVARDAQGAFAVPREEILAKSPQAYDGAEALFPFLEFDDPGVKPVRLSRVMSALDFTGVYCPYTGESNVNMDSPACMLASTAAHELAHQRGFSSEQECNFLAVLAATTCGDPVYAYSGWLSGFIYLGNALYAQDPEGYWAIRETLPAGAARDLADQSAYWAQFAHKTARKVSNRVYDAFLKGYGQEQGLRSYGTVVDLLVVYYRDAARAAETLAGVPE